MYYEEKLMNGILFCRTMPNGDWRPAVTAWANAVNALAALTDSDRMEAFRHFCKYCGCIDDNTFRSCQCWNDE